MEWMGCCSRYLDAVCCPGIIFQNHERSARGIPLLFSFPPKRSQRRPQLTTNNDADDLAAVEPKFLTETLAAAREVDGAVSCLIAEDADRMRVDVAARDMLMRWSKGFGRVVRMW
jgi:hypothetical protein